jgi:heat shock protein HslJ
MRKAFVFAALIATVFAACADPGEEAASDPTTTAWVLEAGTLDGSDIPTVEGHPITLVFDTEAGMASGTSACNQYFGAYTLSGAELTFTDIGQTMMACTDPPEVMESETAYLTALGLVEIFTLEGNELNISGEGADLLFVLDESAQS